MVKVLQYTRTSHVIQIKLMYWFKIQKLQQQNQAMYK